jgi:hypothetical protein
MFDIADVAYLPLLKDITLIRYQLHSFSDRHTFYQCSGSGMFIPDPDFYLSGISDLGSRIPDPKTVTKEKGEKNSFHTFFLESNISQH